MSSSSSSFDPPDPSRFAAPEGWGIPERYKLDTRRKNRYRGAAAWQTNPVGDPATIASELPALLTAGLSIIEYLTIFAMAIDDTTTGEGTGYYGGQRDPMNYIQRMPFKYPAQRDLVRRLYHHSADRKTQFSCVFHGSIAGLLVGDLHQAYNTELGRRNQMMRHLDPAMKNAAKEGFTGTEIDTLLDLVTARGQSKANAEVAWGVGGVEVTAIRNAAAGVWAGPWAGPNVTIEMQNLVKALFIAKSRTHANFDRIPFNTAWTALSNARVAVMVQNHTIPDPMSVPMLDAWRAEMHTRLTAYHVAIGRAHAQIHT